MIYNNIIILQYVDWDVVFKPFIEMEYYFGT